jgi:DNA processing protein
MNAIAACDGCLARTWLLARLAGHLDLVRNRILPLLALPGDELIAAVAGVDTELVLRELAAFDPAIARAACRNASLDVVCRCDPAYPSRLLELESPPAVLHLAGGCERLSMLCGGEQVAVVGARAASPYGLAVARSLGRGLAAAGITVVSGMALGTDAEAHAGALGAGGRTVAVLGSDPAQPYPRSRSKLHLEIRATGLALSELGPGVPVRAWMFPARNRIIAGLAAMTVVVQARVGSGSLLTAARAVELGRIVGAVPGQVTAPLSAGPHVLLRAGAVLVRDARDVFEALAPGAQSPPDGWRPPRRPQPDASLAPLLALLADGHETGAALALAGLDADRGLAALAELELSGHLTRAPGGRYAVAP